MLDAAPFAYAEYVAGLKRTLDKLPWERVERVVDVLDAARLAGHRVFIFGNGGSASTASHMACDLGKNTVMQRLDGLAHGVRSGQEHGDARHAAPAHAFAERQHGAVLGPGQ